MGFAAWHFAMTTEIELLSKSQKPLTRYFPELVAELSSLKAKKFVLDGEIVISLGGKLSFDHLLMRIHPAEKPDQEAQRRDARASLSSSICWLTSRASRQLISRFANDDVT